MDKDPVIELSSANKVLMEKRLSGDSQYKSVCSGLLTFCRNISNRPKNFIQLSDKLKKSA